MRSLRRLRAVRQQLAAAAEEAAAGPLERSPSPHLAEQMTLPRQLEQDDSGFLVPEDVAMLEALEAEAVGRREYRLAAQLRDTLDVLTPRAGGPLTLADVAPEDPLDALRCFWENGFCVFHGLLEGTALERARAAWLRAEPAARAEFEATLMGNHGEPGNSFTYGIPDLMELDDCFVDLADHPKLVAVVQHVAGAGGLADGDDELTPPMDRRYHGTMRLGNMSGNIVTSQTSDGVPNALGYTL